MKVADSIRSQTVPAGAVAIWWLGQNSYVIRDGGTIIMVDPFFSRPKDPERYVHAEAPIRADEIKPDAVLCTHNHSDHTDPPFLSALAHHSPTTRFLGPPETADAITGAGIRADRVERLRAGDLLTLASASIEVVLSKTPEISDVGHFGYIIGMGGIRVYDTGDIMRGVTKEPSLMEPLRRAAPHVALITTSPTEEEFPDFEEAAALATAIGAQVAVPAHYDCFAKRTFDPKPFAAAFADMPTQAQIIPYCGCLIYPPRPSE